MTGPEIKELRKELMAVEIKTAINSRIVQFVVGILSLILIGTATSVVQNISQNARISAIETTLADHIHEVETKNHLLNGFFAGLEKGDEEDDEEEKKELYAQSKGKR